MGLCHMATAGSSVRQTTSIFIFDTGDSGTHTLQVASPTLSNILLGNSDVVTILHDKRTVVREQDPPGFLRFTN